LAGGFRPKVPLYDTEGGWLHLATEELVAGAKASQAAGWTGVKIKVGKDRIDQDVERLRAVRAAVGEGLDIMVDANQSMTQAEAVRRAAAFAPLNLAWFEEPLPADDVSGHIALARSTTIPVAVGESLYSLAQFREYLQRGAASIVQVDVARVGASRRGSRSRTWPKRSTSTSARTSCWNCTSPWSPRYPTAAMWSTSRNCGRSRSARCASRTGHAVAPDGPGLGIDWDRDEIENRTVA
jgi:L-alanine-DL-glutamate epimerase-like enolase superfamily enzyme